MGAYLIFKVANKKDTETAAKALAEIEENKEMGIYITCKYDIEWAKKQSNKSYWVNFMKGNMGKGEYKVNSHPMTEEVLEKIVCILEILNEKVKMRYFSKASAFNGEYFTSSQISRITKDGLFMSSVE